MRARALSHIPTTQIAAKLQRRRSELMAEVAQIDLALAPHAPMTTVPDLAHLEGAPHTASRTSRRGKRRGARMTFAEAMVKVIGDGKKSVAEIVSGIAATGYSSKSKNLPAMAAIQLGQRKDLFRRVKRGVYAVR